MKGRKFIDFNGVILDTESRMIELKRQYPGLTWNEFANTLDWDFLLRTSPVIDDAIALLREVSQMNDARTTILTNVDLIVEEIAKVHFLRNQGITLPIQFVPPSIQKSEVYIPDKDDILVDDRPDNVMFWNQCGGKGYLFDPNNQFPESLPKIKSLKYLWK